MPVTRLLTGQLVRCIINAANTGAATLAIKRPDGTAGVAATSIKRADGSTALSSGDLVADRVHDFVYDGTNLRLVNGQFGGTLVGDDETYGSGWNSDLTFPTKNAVYDKIETLVSDTAYSSDWNGVTGTAPSKNAVYDKLEAFNLASGVYTPTLTNVANLDGSTTFECQYSRVGSVVTVSGKVSVNPTLTATSTQLGISLPIASDFGAQEDCGGVAFAQGIAGQGAGISGDNANNRAHMQWVSSDVTDQAMNFVFQYQVI